jgi:RNase P subunit RPR2
MNPQKLKCSQCENPTFKLYTNITDESLTKIQIVCTNCGTVHIYQKLQLNINLT